MFSISSFLEKFKNIGAKSTAPRKATVKACSLQGIVVDEKSITIRGGIAYVKAHPAVKNQIFLKKASILNFLKNDPSGSLVGDIR